MPEVHATLSASGSKRWMACPRSLALEHGIKSYKNGEYAPPEANEFALEGTIAHDYSERILNAMIKGKGEEAKKILADLKMKNVEMHDAVNMYVTVCMNKYFDLQLIKDNVIAFVEYRVDFSKWVPGGFGTADFLILTDDEIYVFDLKFGHVLVEAYNNSQLKLYALGAYNDFRWMFKFNSANVNIVQPRRESHTSESHQIDDLLAWGEDVKKKADLVLSDNPPLMPGDHCKYCKVDAICVGKIKYLVDKVEEIKDGKNKQCIDIFG